MNKTLTVGGDFTVNRIGLGTNRIVNDEASRTTLKKAVELGFNFIDTASAYTGGISEKVIGQTISKDEKTVIATKGGMHAPDFRVDSRPESLAKQLANSLSVLNRDRIDLYFLHRVDPNVEFADQIKFLKLMQDEEKIKHVGLSHVTVEQIERARKIVEVAAVENEYNISNRENDDVVNYCEKENIVFIPYYPLHGETNRTTSELMNKYNATNAQIQLAWLLKRSDIILPIPGSLSPNHLEENFRSLEIELSEDDFKKV